MTEGWKTKNLQSCFEKVTYTNKVQRKSFLEDGIYPIISQEMNLINGFWNDSSDVFNIKKPVVIFGDHTKAIKYVDFDFVLGADGVKILQPIIEIDTKFLYYFLHLIKLKDLGYARHYRLLKEIDISYPPIPEQRRIVLILDDAFTALARAQENTKKNLQNTRELFDSYLESVFANPTEDWEEKKFVEACTLQRGFDLPKRLREIGRYPIVSSSGIIDMHNVFKVKGPGVVTGRSGSIGNVFYIDKDFWPLNTVLYVKDFHDNHARFIYYLLKRFDLTRFSGGAGVPTLNRNNVHHEMLHIPKSILIQKALAEKFDCLSIEIRNLESIYQRKLNDLEELKKSFLQKAFAGEL